MESLYSRQLLKDPAFEHIVTYMQALVIGDVVKLKPKYYEGNIAIVINIHKAASPGYPGHDGWISFDYVVLTDDSQILHISDDCILEVISRLA